MSNSNFKIFLQSTFSFFLLLTCAFANAQTQTQIPAPANRRPVPLPILYRHFLAYQNHLDSVGIALNKKGEDGAEFRDHFQRLLGFSDSDFAAVRTTAVRLEAKLKEHDAKIKAVIDTARARSPRIVRRAADLPPVPPELKQLQKERETIVEDEITQLNAALGPTRAAKLQSVIENDFAPNVRVQSVHPLQPQDLLKHPLPPPQEVQP